RRGWRREGAGRGHKGRDRVSRPLGFEQRAVDEEPRVVEPHNFGGRRLIGEELDAGVQVSAGALDVASVACGERQTTTDSGRSPEVTLAAAFADCLRPHLA